MCGSQVDSEIDIQNKLINPELSTLLTGRYTDIAAICNNYFGQTKYINLFEIKDCDISFEEVNTFNKIMSSKIYQTADNICHLYNTIDHRIEIIKIHEDYNNFLNETYIYNHIHQLTNNNVDNSIIVNIPKLYESFCDECIYVVILEYIEGTLLSMMTFNNTDQICAIFAQIYDLCDKLININVCHLDFHGYNVIIDNNSVVYLIDFEKSINYDTESNIITYDCYNHSFYLDMSSPFDTFVDGCNYINGAIFFQFLHHIYDFDKTITINDLRKMSGIRENLRYFEYMKLHPGSFPLQTEAYVNKIADHFFKEKNQIQYD